MKSIPTTQLLGATLVVASIAGGTAIAIASIRPSKVEAKVGRSAGVPSVDSPEVRAALVQTKGILDAARAENWRYGLPPVPMDELILPGQRNAEDPRERGPRFVSFRLPSGEDGYDPEMAFYSETYVRRNLRHLPGEHTASTPEGFYIVAYRDGRVVTVPAAQARKRPLPRNPKRPEATITMIVFPGMAHYDDPETTPQIPLSD